MCELETCGSRRRRRRDVLQDRGYETCRGAYDDSAKPDEACVGTVLFGFVLLLNYIVHLYVYARSMYLRVLVRECVFVVVECIQSATNTHTHARATLPASLITRSYRRFRL